MAAGERHLFVGEDPMRLERHWRVIDHIGFHYGRAWPLDLALWDIKGKRAGLPVYQLIGGRSRFAVDTYTHCAGTSLQALEAQVKARLAQDGTEAVASTPEQFAAFLKSERDQWAKAAKIANIRNE